MSYLKIEVYFDKLEIYDKNEKNRFLENKIVHVITELIDIFERKIKSLINSTISAVKVEKVKVESRGSGYKLKVSLKNIDYVDIVKLVKAFTDEEDNMIQLICVILEAVGKNVPSESINGFLCETSKNISYECWQEIYKNIHKKAKKIGLYVKIKKIKIWDKPKDK